LSDEKSQIKYTLFPVNMDSNQREAPTFRTCASEY
jgi:hypothetical protein